MEVKLAESAGFCYGVRRALDTVLEVAARSGGRMFTLGPLIHNPQVISRLEEQGVKSVRSLDEIPEGSIVVMPSHGVPREVMERAGSSGLKIVDLTCPFVSKVHQVVRGLVDDGYQVVVLGDKGHTEVRGIMSAAGEDAIAVANADELAGLNLKDRVGIVSQTTQTIEDYEKLVEAVKVKSEDVRAFNTICHATMDRQKAALDIAEQAEVMVVVGGRNSANTRRLKKICAKTGVPTYHVEIADEIDPAWFAGAESVGVTAGASTPDWIIEEVMKRISDLGG